MYYAVECCLTDYLAHFCSNFLAQESAFFGTEIRMRAMKCVGLFLGLANH